MNAFGDQYVMYTLQVYGPCDRDILEMVSSYVFDNIEEALTIKGVIQRVLLCEVSVQG